MKKTLIRASDEDLFSEPRRLEKDYTVDPKKW
jgi:hypothetical protein